MRWERNLGVVFKSKKRKVLEERELLDQLRDEAKPEKGDLFALIIASITTLVPVVIVILLLYYLISMFIFR